MGHLFRLCSRLYYSVFGDGTSANVSASRRRQLPRQEVPLSSMSECLQIQEASLLSLEICVQSVAEIQLPLLRVLLQVHMERA